MKILNEKRKLFWDQLDLLQKYRFSNLKNIVQNDIEITEKDLEQFKQMCNIFLLDLDTIKNDVIEEFKNGE
jgi:hypothetical protein